MIKWLKHKEYPEFCNTYSKHFKQNNSTDLNSTRFIVFDTETTGLNPSEDRILSIGAISVFGNKIDIADSLEMYLKQDTFNAETVEIHGILKEGSISKYDEEEAIIKFLDYIKDAVLVAHHTAFDIAMINEALKRLGLPKLKNKSLDTGILFKKTTLHKTDNKHYGLDELSNTFNIKKHDRHTASSDAYITGLIFLKIISNLKQKNKTITLKDLYFNSNRRGLI